VPGSPRAPRPGGPVATALAPVRAWLGDAGPQTLLAAGGVLLLVIAAGVFLAVTWRDLPVPVRGGVVAAGAVASGRLTASLVGRGLTRTAEATGVLTLALLAVLADGSWRAGLLDALGSDVGVLAQVSALLAIVSDQFGRATGVRSPLVLAAWLIGTAVHAAGVWLIDPYAAVGATPLDLLASQAVNLIAVGASGTYATRVLTVVPRWRLATLVAAANLWVAATVTVVVVVAGPAMDATADPVAAGAGLAVAAGCVGVAGAARRIDGPLSRWWSPAGTGAMWWAGTLAGAATLVGRTAVWPDMPALLPLAVGVGLLPRVRARVERGCALLGMAPVALLGLRPVVGTAQWVVSSATVPVQTGALVVRVASCLLVCVLAGAAGLLVPRARVPALLVSAVAWIVAVAGGALTLAVLAPSEPAHLPPFLGAAAAVVAAGALAVLAGRVGSGAAAAWWPAGVALAVTAGTAGALAGRLAAWPHLPLVASLALAATLAWTRRDDERVAAVVGAGPAMACTVWPAALALGRIVGVVVRPAAAAPDVVGTASLALVAGLVVSMAAAVHRVVRVADRRGTDGGRRRVGTPGVPARTARAARATALSVAAVAWTVAALGAAADLSVLAPSRTDDIVPFGVAAALVGALAGMAWMAGRLGLVGDAAAAAGVAFVATTATAAAWGRVPVWPDLPVVAAATLGTVLVWTFRSRSARWGALVGAAPVALAAVLPVAGVIVWITGELAWRVVVPWPSIPGPVAPPPAVATLASAGVVSALVVAVVYRMWRLRVAALVAVGAGGAVLLACATAAWNAGGGAVAGVAVGAVAVAALRNRPDDPAWSAVLVVVALVTAAVSLTAPAITITTLVAGAAVSTTTVGVRSDRGAGTSTAVCTAQILAAVAAAAAAMTHRPGVVGVAVVTAAGGGWLVAATVRSRLVQAAAVEVTATAAMIVGLGLAWAADALLLGIALAAVATASAAVAVWRGDRRWMRWVSSAAATGSSWSILSDAGVTTVEAYTVPPALLIAVLAATGLVRDPRRSSWPLLGSALTLLTLPTLLQLFDDPSDLRRLAGAVASGAVLAVVGRRWSLQSPVVIGVGVAGAAALTQHGVVIDVLPRWLLLALAGALLLWLSISYERQVERLTAARRHLVAMR
jgi:hypothetical protein